MKRVLFQPTISYSEVIISIQNKLNAILKELLPSEIEFSQKEEINFEIQNILKEHFKSSVKINQSPSLNGNILLITFAMNIEYNDVFYLNKHFIIDGEVRVDFLSEDNGKFIDLNQFTLTYNVTNNEKEFMKEVFNLSEPLKLTYQFEEGSNFKVLSEYCAEMKELIVKKQNNIN